jgi:hypothetical protein
MLKRIPKSDISIRPFKAYKEWSFDESSNDISLFEANISSSELSNGIPKNSLYGQLRAQFYNGHEDNPFLRFGAKSNIYTTNQVAKERYLGNDVKVISIPQIYVGEGIKKGSVSLIDGIATIQDDSNGNLVLLGNDTITFNEFNVNGDFYTFELGGSSYTVRITHINIETGELLWYYNSNFYDARIISFDIMTGDMIVDNVDFASSADSVQKVGNVFYNAGLITMNRNPNDRLLGNWDLSYKSTKTIYEHEYLLIVNEDEFNVSQNPSAIVEVGKVEEYITGSDGKIYKTTSTPGVKYIRKKSTLETGNELDFRFTGSYSASVTASYAGFEHYDLSGSMDSTGSFLAPFITTIGLYDDNCDLVAIAKLPQPIKSEPDIPVNFIIRFDT